MRDILIRIYTTLVLGEKKTIDEVPEIIRTDVELAIAAKAEEVL